MVRRTSVVLLFSVLVIAGVFSALASPASVPAFLWSSDQLMSSEVKDAVNYQIVSPKDLANSVVSEGGWSNFLCSGKKQQKPVDLGLIFIGRELQSGDVSRNKIGDSSLVNLLKESFTKSKFSMAFPYVSAAKEERMETSLVSGFAEACGHDLEATEIVYSESCSLNDGSIKKVADFESFQGRLVSTVENRKEGQSNLFVFCSGSSQSAQEVDQPHAESEIISKLISSVEGSGTKYAALYVSDPYRYPSFHELQRFLAESAAGNETMKDTVCDEVCRIKASLLEGLLVAIVLLLILISGLCCMMGIDTPTRFETPQDS